MLTHSHVQHGEDAFFFPRAGTGRKKKGSSVMRGEESKREARLDDEGEAGGGGEGWGGAVSRGREMGGRQRRHGRKEKGRRKAGHRCRQTARQLVTRPP